MRNELSLDVGAGENPKGNVNVDIRRLPRIHVICHALHLPFKNEVFSCVYLSHVIEHFTYKDVELCLKEVNRVLKPKGGLELWVPNLQSVSVLMAWITSRIVWRGMPMILPMLSGGQDYKENVHLSLWTAKLLKVYLERNGFKGVRMEGESKILFLSRKMPSRCVVIRCQAVKVG